MKFEILKQTENKLLGRREIDFMIDHMGSITPKRADVSSKIAALLDADPACVVIYRMKTRYGIGKTTGSARIYSNVDQLKSIEFTHLINRQSGKKSEASSVTESATESDA